MHGDIPAYKESVRGKADGTDLPITGPMHFRASLSHSSKSLPAKSLTLLRATEKPNSYGIQTLAADGKSFTDVSWSAGKSGEKATGFYAKR
jgi:hypothetical protein